MGIGSDSPFTIHDLRVTNGPPLMDHPNQCATPASRPRLRAYSWFKAAVFGLLAWNTAVFVHSGTLAEGVDSVAWLLLLALFELETGGASLPRRSSAVIHGARLVAAVAIPVAAVGYVLDREWLDAINATVWIAVVLMLEFQVRFPRFAARYRAVVVAVATGLYSSLGWVALVWLWRSEWFSAYDALLWLVAFATIEINVLQAVRRWPAAERAVLARTE